MSIRSRKNYVSDNDLPCLLYELIVVIWNKSKLFTPKYFWHMLHSAIINLERDINFNSTWRKCKPPNPESAEIYFCLIFKKYFSNHWKRCGTKDYVQLVGTYQTGHDSLYEVSVCSQRIKMEKVFGASKIIPGSSIYSWPGWDSIC